MILAVLQSIVATSVLAGPPAAAAPAPSANASVAIAPAHDTPDAHRLHLYHTHTAETLDIVYRDGEEYVPEAIDQLDYFLRDHRTGDVHHFDPRLYDLLNDLAASLGRPDARIDVVCGYRTPESNAYLRRRSRRVARHSLHMEAEAIDIRVPGVSTKELQLAALSLHRGGVGYYRRSHFVHVDVGPVRRW
jgi:uncharacterized protein YcbK (DUF882 family)